MLSARDNPPRKRSGGSGGGGEGVDENYDKQVFGSAMFAWERKKMMVELDKQGCVPFHYACLQGDVKKMRRFMDVVDELVEMPIVKTHPLYPGYSPLMCAVYGGSLDATHFLIREGAKVEYMTDVCLDVIDVVIGRHNKVLFDFFKNNYNDDLQTISKLCKFLQSPDDNLVMRAAKFAAKLTEKTEAFPISPYAQEFIDCGLVKIFLKTVQSEAPYELKRLAFDLIFNIIEFDGFTAILLGADTITILIRLAKSHLADSLDQKILIPLSSLLLHLCKEKPEKFVQNQAHIFVLQLCVKMDSEVTLCNLFGCVSAMIKSISRVGDEILQSKYNEHLVKMYSRTKGKDLLMVLNKLVLQSCDGREQNQNYVTRLGITEALITIIGRSKSFQVQESCTETLRIIVENNRTCQDKALELGALTILGDILKKNRQNIPAQATCVNTMWSLVRGDLYRRRLMADVIGVALLLDYLPQTPPLSIIALEALEILASGPNAKPEEIGNGIVLLVSICNNKNSSIAIGSLRLLRRISIRPGLVPVKRNVELIRSSDGLRNLMTIVNEHSDQEVAIEAAITLAYVSIGVPDLETYTNTSRLEIIESIRSKLTSEKNETNEYPSSVLPRVGEAIAALYFHKWSQITEQDPKLSFADFAPFITEKITRTSIIVAFQVVIISKLFCDVSAAQGAAKGIRQLVRSLRTQLDPEIQVHTCEMIAALTKKGHPGVVDGLVSVGTVQLLVNLVHSPDSHVSYMATVPLANLTLNYTAERHILNICRKDPHTLQSLMKLHNEQHVHLGSHFLEEWNHYLSIGLPGHNMDIVASGGEGGANKAGKQKRSSSRGRNRIVIAANKYMKSIANINLDATEEEVMDKLRNGSIPVTSFAADE